MIVMRQRFPPARGWIFCQWCRAKVARVFSNFVLKGAGILETVEVQTEMPIRVCKRDGTSEVYTTAPCWACSDECEARLLELNGLDGSLAGLALPGPTEETP